MNYDENEKNKKQILFSTLIFDKITLFTHRTAALLQAA